MNSSYQRYWEPTTTQALASSVLVGAGATIITYPLDVVKTIIQQRAEGIGIRQYNFAGGYNPNKIFRELHESGIGLRGIYHGIDSALIGRSAYLLIRNGIYKLVYDRFKPAKPRNDLTIKEKGVIAGIAGGIAAFVTNPIDVVLTRQQVDHQLPPELRRNYSTFFDGYKVVSQEGAGAGLLRGVSANVLRAVALNVSLSFPYNDLNERMWVTFGDTFINRPIALVYAATVGTLVALPFDNIKTRMQIAFPDPSKNRINYDNLRDVVKKIFVIEGPTGLLVGFYAFYAKTFIYALTTIYAMDVITNKWKRKAGHKEDNYL